MSNKVAIIKQAIDELLLSCKVEGKSYGTIDFYSGKLEELILIRLRFNNW